MLWQHTFSPWAGRSSDDPDKHSAVLNATLRGQQQADKLDERYRVLCHPSPHLFDPLVPALWLLDALRVMSKTPRIDWVLITERPRDQASLAHTPGFEQLHGVILAGDSGPRAQPLHPVWARAVRDDCRQLGVPLFFESWGDWMPRTERMASGNTCELADPRLTRWTCQEISSDNLTGRNLRHASGERVYKQKVGANESGHWLDRTQWRQEPAPLEVETEQGAAG